MPVLCQAHVRRIQPRNSPRSARRKLGGECMKPAVACVKHGSNGMRKTRLHLPLRAAVQQLPARRDRFLLGLAVYFPRHSPRLTACPRQPADRPGVDMRDAAVPMGLCLLPSPPPRCRNDGLVVLVGTSPARDPPDRPACLNLSTPETPWKFWYARQRIVRSLAAMGSTAVRGLGIVARPVGAGAAFSG
jgi:hypothetical protein